MTECWSKARECDLSKKFNTAERFLYKGVAKCAYGSETTDWSFQLSAILQEILSGWWQLALLANECLVWLGVSWIAKARIFVSEWHTRFQQYFFKLRNKRSRLTERFHNFAFKCILRAYVGLEMRNSINCHSPETHCMRFSGFQTHSDSCWFGTETARGGQARVVSLWVQGGSGQDFSSCCGFQFCGRGAEADKRFQPAQNSGIHKSSGIPSDDHSDNANTLLPRPLQRGPKHFPVLMRYFLLRWRCHPGIHNAVHLLSNS